MSTHKKAPSAPTPRASDNVETIKVNNVMTYNSTVPKKETHATVDFHGHSLIVITAGDQRLVAMRPVCEGIGLAWNGQLERIKRDEVLSEGMRVIRTPSTGGEQATVCIPLDMLNGWLFGIEVKRCRKEIRPALVQYKRECYAALAAYWNDGIAIKHHDRDAASVLGTTIGTDGFHCLGAVLGGKVRHLPVPARKRATMHVWSQVHKAFSVVSAQDIPAEQLDSARNFIAAYSLDGEWLPKEKPSERFTDWLNLNALITCMQRTQELWRQHGLYQHLTHGGSRVGVEMLDYIQDGHLVASMLKREYSVQLDSGRRLASEACNRALATA